MCMYMYICIPSEHLPFWEHLTVFFFQLGKWYCSGAISCIYAALFQEVGCLPLLHNIGQNAHRPCIY